MRQNERNEASSPLKVVHLATTDFGGAGKAAYRLHQGLLASGVDSTMLVVNRKNREPSVRILPSGPLGGVVDCPEEYPENVAYAQRIWEHWTAQVCRYPGRQPGMEIFSDDYSEISLECMRQIREADIVNLHWVAGLFNCLNAPLALKGKQVVWTMHDMNPATGGCHYAGECTGYLASCGGCPMLGSRDQEDISRGTWQLKNYAYRKLDLTPVSPSRWLARVASQSSLLSPFKTRVIPNGFPVDVFTPCSRRDEVRARHGVPPGAKVVLFGAESLLTERKGFVYLLQALQGMATDGMVFAFFGRLPDEAQLALKLPLINLGFVQDESALAELYSMADLFVIPSIEDNLPNTVVEAMLCGVPVVGFDIGGIPDMVEHKRTGYLVPPRDVAALVDGINWCLFHPEAAGMGARCREKAVANYSLEVQAASYRALYRELLGQPAESRSPSPGQAERQGSAPPRGSAAMPESAALPGVAVQAATAQPAAPRLSRASLHPEGAKGYLVSAIVSTYNAERFLRGKLEDLEAQTIAADLEIIVIDSCSGQNERAIVAEFQARYPNIRYLRTEQRETVYQAWNRGIRMATGEFVTNANTDDRLRRDAYETLVRALREHPECVLAYPDFRITEEENQTFESHRPLGFRDWPPYDRLSLLELCCIGPFPLWRKSLHDEIGYFDERYRSIADYEFWLRAALEHQFIHVPEFLGLYWLSPETVSRKGDLPALEYLHIQQQYRPRFAPLTPAPRVLTPQEEAEYRAVLERSAGNLPEAIAQLERFTALKPGCAEAHQELAQLYYKGGDIGHARKHFEKAAILAPGSPQHRDNLQAFLKSELYQSLQHHIAQAAADPDNLEPHLGAGLICLLLERPEAARIHYQRALALAPDNVLARENLAALERHPVPPDPGLSDPERPEQALTSLVLLTFNEVECTRECLESIERNTPEPHEVILVDNGSTDGTLPFLREYCAARNHYRLVENGRDPGFAAGCNIGMRLARGGRILLLNSDVVVTGGWLSGLLECLERDPRLAIVGPMTNGSAGAQRLGETSYDNLEELEQFARSFKREHAGRRIPVERVAGFCMLFTRGLMESLGELDQGFGTGNLEDDYCLRAALAGFGCAIAGDVFIHHYGSRSFRANGMGDTRVMAQNRAIFDAKWDLGQLDETLAKKLVTHNALSRGRRLAASGRLGEAVEVILQQGIQFSPKSPEPYRVLAEMLAEAGRFQDALEVLEQMPGGDEVVRLTLAGQCRLGLEKLPHPGPIPGGEGELDALALAERALSLDPECAGALCLKGAALLERGETAAAEELFRAGIAADLGFGPCYSALAGLAWQRGSREEALNLAELGFVLSPLDMGALARYHNYAELCAELPREERRVREALALLFEHRGLAFGLIEILIRRGCYRQAMDQIERAAVKFGLDDAMIDAALHIRELAAAEMRRGASQSPPPGGGNSAPTTPKPGTISVCMIVKDEAAHLPAALLSIKQLADDLVVVDTGSTDRSRDIARLFGARLFSFPWNGSFSDARNFSISQALGEWIFVLDADEVLAACDLEPLRALLQRTAAPTAYSFTTRNYIEEITRKNWSANAGEYPGEERGSGWTPSEKVRLFPNDRRVRFQGAVHELLELSLVNCGITIHACDVPVHHYGKLDPVKNAEKQERYYLLGLKKLSETEASLESLTELALQATELGRFEEAEGLWHRLLQARPESADAYFNLGYLHLASANYRTARVHALKGAELAPDMKEAAFNLAKCDFFLGNTEQAAAACREMLRKWPGYPPARSLLGVSCLILGRRDEAESLVHELRRQRFDCLDFLNEYSDGLLKGERGDLALPLQRFAQGFIPGQAA